MEPQCTIANLLIEHSGLDCHLPLLQLCVILLLKPLEVLGAHSLLQHRFHFKLSCPRLRRQKYLRFTIPISEREPLRLARATQNSLRAFGCRLNGSCGSSTCPWTFILTIDLQFEDLNSSHHIFLQMGSILWDDWNSEYITIFCPEVAKEDFCPTRLDGGCWEDQVMLLCCTGRVRILLRKYCWPFCFDIVLASQW